MEAQYAAISICVADEIIVVVITLLNWLQCAGIICIKTAAENPVQRISRAPVQQKTGTLSLLWSNSPAQSYAALIIGLLKKKKHCTFILHIAIGLIIHP